METAGIDRPDITSFEGSTVRTTRQASAGQTPESPPRSSKVQVIIESDASLLRNQSSLQATSRKLKEPPDKDFKSKSVDPSEEDRSSATATSDVGPSETEGKKGKSVALEGFGRPDLILEKSRTVLH